MTTQCCGRCQSFDPLPQGALQPLRGLCHAQSPHPAPPTDVHRAFVVGAHEGAKCPAYKLDILHTYEPAP